MTSTLLIPAGFPMTAPSPSTPRVLREYQIEAADKVVEAFARNVIGPAVVLPTGSGKTTVIAELTRRDVLIGGRVLLMAHRNELIEQMSDAVAAVSPDGPVPAKIGGPHRGDPGAQIVSATVQSLQNAAALERLGMRDLVIVDEAHHAVAATYRKVLDHFHDLGGRRAGFTATMTRSDPGKGEPPLRAVWQEVVFERDLAWAIDNGFLLRPDGVTVDVGLDSSILTTGRGGEITDESAEEAMMRDTTLNATVDAVLTRTGGRSTIVFGASLVHCEQLSTLLVAHGVTAEVVVGSTSTRTRDGIYRRFRSGQSQVLVTVDVLTEGADFPRCEVVVLARPTKSQTRLVQCVGRALRPHTFEDGTVKENALVVDLVGAGSLGLIVKTQLDAEVRAETEQGLGCGCEQPCSGNCALSCTGVGCGCECDCAGQGDGSDMGVPETSAVPCTCTCTQAFGLCRCGCQCDSHRVDPLTSFDPVSGITQELPKRRHTDSAWSVRTNTIRWTSHPRGLVRPVYRADGSKGTLLLADMRGVPGTRPGNDWAYGFLDTTVHRMFWVDLDGKWSEPGPGCYLQGFDLSTADRVANAMFPGHLRDAARSEPTTPQVALASSLGIQDAGAMDRRDLSDLIALAQADRWFPQLSRAGLDDEPAA